MLRLDSSFPPPSSDLDFHNSSFPAGQVGGLRGSLPHRTHFGLLLLIAGAHNPWNTITFCFIVPSPPIEVWTHYCLRPHPIRLLDAAVPGSTEFSPHSHTEYLNFCGTWHFASCINISPLIFSPFPSSCFMRNDVLLEVCSGGMNTMGWICTHKLQN